MTVDEILATGKYTDRRGGVWNYDPDFDVWVEYSSRDDGILHLGWIVDTKDVRLLIERDQHRDECDSLGNCVNHPVVSITRNFRGKWSVYAAHECLPMLKLRSFPAAMSAARALAVGG